MKIADMNWLQVESYLQHDDRAVIPLGSTEQHAYLSLSTDSILAERVAVEAVEPIGVAVFPIVAYGITPYFMAYPGTISLRVNTYLQVIHDILESLTQHGFRECRLHQRARRQHARAKCLRRILARSSRRANQVA